MRRKLWVAISTPLLALAFFLVGNPAAHALGSEVLGCSFDTGAWYANACSGGENLNVNNTIHFTPQNLTGTYSMTWTVTNTSGSAVPNCSSATPIACISSGCTATSTTCDLLVHTHKYNDQIFTASLKLVQSGWTKTLQAQATVYSAGLDPCPTC